LILKAKLVVIQGQKATDLFIKMAELYRYNNTFVQYKAILSSCNFDKYAILFVA